ncbi:MAG: hypothetical protein ACRDNP_13820, partial [Gaiellaceae bacterium]
RTPHGAAETRRRSLARRWAMSARSSRCRRICSRLALSCIRGSHALTRLFERMPWEAIEKPASLSHRKVNYIRLAIKHGDLDWDHEHDRIVLGPKTRNTPAGLVLPVR